MIRLTEQGRKDGVVRLRLEGSLTADGLRVVQLALADLSAEGLKTVVLEGDGIAFVDRLSVREWPTVVPEGLVLRLTTTRRALHQLLTSYGIAVELVTPHSAGDA